MCSRDNPGIIESKHIQECVDSLNRFFNRKRKNLYALKVKENDLWNIHIKNMDRSIKQVISTEFDYLEYLTKNKVYG